MWGGGLGRDACTECLRATLESGKAALSLAVVEGTAGMGKTTLLAQLLDDPRDTHVRRAGGRILQQRVPFGVLDELLDGSVSEAFDAGADDPLTWTLRGADLLVDEITTVTTTRPAVIVIDDLQWVDPVSLVALDRALPRIAHEPVTVLLALRPEGRTTAEVAALLDAADATLVRLGPLSDEEAAALVRELAPERSEGEIAAIVRNGAGNPLYVRHLAEAEPGELSLGPVVTAHLAELPRDVRSVIRIASLGGTGIDARLLEAVSGQPVVGALGVAAASGLVVQEGAGWRFEHDLVRDAVAEVCTPPERDRYHRAYATALSARADAHSVAEAVVHVVAAGPPFTDAEMDLVLRVARDAVPTDPARAEELFGLLLDIIPETDPRHATARTGLRDAQYWTERGPVEGDAESALRRLREVYVENALAPHDVNDTEAIVRRELDGETRDDALSWLASMAPGPRLVEELTDREASLSELARIRLASARVWLAFGSGALVRAGELARELLGLTQGRQATDELRIDATLIAGRMLICLGDTRDEGFELLATAARATEEAGLPRHQIAVASHFGAARYFWTEWDEAQGLFSTAMSMALDVGRLWGDNARRCLFQIAIQQGDRATIERLGLGPGDWDPWLLREIGRDRQLADDHEEAKRILSRVALDRDAAPHIRTDALYLYALSAHLTDDDRGRELVRSAARTIPGEGVQVRAGRAGALALVNLDPFPLLEGIGAQAPPVPLADGAEGMGHVHQALGNVDAAIEHFTFARDVWRKCGADARLARVAGWLRELGVRSRGRTDPQRPRIGWDAVTDAEMRVAALVAEGLIYQDIADRLFLSRRTVETHVASILRKIGLRNRGELAASYLRRQGESSA